MTFGFTHVPRQWLRLTWPREVAVDHAETVSIGLLAALGSLEDGEVLVLQWLLGPVRRPLAVPIKTPDTPGESWTRSFIKAPLWAPSELDSQARRALLAKQGEPG